MRVTALDIGQGDATLIETPDARVLVDTGPPGIALRRQLRAVKRLDVLVLTHPQLDHIGDAPRLLAETPVGLVLDGRGADRTPLSRSIDGPVRIHRTRLLAAESGQRLTVGSLRLDVLWPPAAGRVPGGDPNDRAIVFVARAFGRSVLLTADAESNVLSALQLPQVDLLKVSHHGSADPGLPTILDRLRPQAAVIEVGKHNEYGHPTKPTLAALARASVSVFRTDQDGAVRFDLGPADVRVTRRAEP
jgi:competence protein ComEC